MLAYANQGKGGFDIECTLKADILKSKAASLLNAYQSYFSKSRLL